MWLRHYNVKVHQKPALVVSLHDVHWKDADLADFDQISFHFAQKFPSKWRVLEHKLFHHSTKRSSLAHWKVLVLGHPIPTRNIESCMQFLFPLRGDLEIAVAAGGHNAIEILFLIFLTNQTESVCCNIIEMELQRQLKDCAAMNCRFQAW